MNSPTPLPALLRIQGAPEFQLFCHHCSLRFYALALLFHLSPISFAVNVLHYVISQYTMVTASGTVGIYVQSGKSPQS